MSREFTQAETLGKELIAVVHEKVALNSAFKDREHTVFRPPDYTLVLLKLMRTIALWNKKLGRAHKVEILPPELGEIIDEDNPAHLCEYRTVVGCLTVTMHRGFHPLVFTLSALLLVLGFPAQAQQTKVIRLGSLVATSPSTEKIVIIRALSGSMERRR